MTNPPPDPLEQLSEAFDFDRVDHWSNDRLDREVIESTTRSWSELRRTLRELPAVPAGLCSNVMEQVQEEHVQKANRAVTAASSGLSDAGSYRLIAALASVAALIVAGVSISRQVGNQATVSESLARIVPAQVNSVLSIPHSDWQVVVLNVPDERHAIVRGKIRDSVVNRGLAVESLVLNGEYATQDSADVFVSSADVAEEMMRAIEAEILNSEGDLSTTPAEDFDREELLSRFQASMESPTQSDRYFGEMLVVRSDADSVVVSKEQLLDSIAIHHRVDENPEKESAAGTAAVAAGNVAESRDGAFSKRPVLIVLLRKKSAMPGPQSESTPPLLPGSGTAAVAAG